MTEMKKITIPREKWLRGPYSVDQNGTVVSCLLDNNGKRCCVGHIIGQHGVVGDLLLEKQVAHQLSELPQSLRWLAKEVKDPCFGPMISSDDGQKLYTTNDDTALNDEQKEANIRAVCARHGLDVKFTGPRLPVVDGIEVRYEDKVVEDEISEKTSPTV